jgi:gas vesicle protein
MLDNLALLGMGALAGAGAALLFAPASGLQLRERLTSQLSKVKGATIESLQEAKQRAPALLEQARGAVTRESTHRA